MRGSRNPQGEQNWNPPEDNLTKRLCLLIIGSFATDGYKTYKYWEKRLKTLIRTNYAIRSQKYRILPKMAKLS